MEMFPQEAVDKARSTRYRTLDFVEVHRSDETMSWLPLQIIEKSSRAAFFPRVAINSMVVNLKRLRRSSDEPVNP